VAIGQPVQLHATGGQHYQWFPPDFLNTDTVFNPVATLNSDQRYQVKVTTAEGCEDTDDIFIRVFKDAAIHVPNAFTPDGQHKIFRPVLAGIQQLYYFSVYNRYGQLVFTTSEPGKGWDGRINGVVQPSGTYVWMLKAKDYQGKLITKNGTMLLIR
jgi:gliding motility-associated-like protein